MEIIAIVVSSVTLMLVLILLLRARAAGPAGTVDDAVQKAVAAMRAESREAGTEAPWTGEYVDTKAPGIYACRACGTELFRADSKFDSHCGWPSFFTPLAGDAVVEIQDRSHGMLRTEVRCASCGSHLGHVFEGEGYPTPTDLRYCINSVCLVHREEPPAASEE